MFFSLIKQNKNYAILEGENMYIHVSNYIFEDDIQETVLYVWKNGKFIADYSATKAKKLSNLNRLNKLKQNK